MGWKGRWRREVLDSISAMLKRDTPSLQVCFAWAEQTERVGAGAHQVAALACDGPGARQSCGKEVASLAPGRPRGPSRGGSCPHQLAEVEPFLATAGGDFLELV